MSKLALTLTRWRDREYVRTSNHGIGNWYWAWERGAEGPIFTRKAWIMGLEHPFREGRNGWRLRVWHRALQVGRCVRHPEYTDVYEQLGGGELGRWSPFRQRDYPMPEVNGDPQDQDEA